MSDLLQFKSSDDTVLFRVSDVIAARYRGMGLQVYLRGVADPIALSGEEAERFMAIMRAPAPAELQAALSGVER